MMKKAVAVLLAACLALQPVTGIVQPVYGAAENAVQIQGESILEAEIISTLSFPYTGNVTVSIRNGKGLEQKQVLTLEKGESKLAEFPVPAGQYTLTVQTDKFAEYVQTVDVEKGWTHRVSICSSQTQSQGSAKQGWIRPGDVNGDGDIDKADSEALAAVVRENQKNAAMDLNNDGRTDLADLNFLVQSMGEQQESSIEKLWIPSEIQPEEGTTAENMNAIFKDEGITRLQKAVISKESPVGITATLAENAASAPLLEGMVIRTAAAMDEDGTVSSQIASGTVILTAADGSETELPIETAPAARTRSKNSASLKEEAQLMSKNSASVREEADGSLVLDFGGQTAVKKVSIRITGTKKNQPFVEIAKVEFLNDMESRIPAPQLDIPSITSVKPGSRELSAEWSPQSNVTGYELYVEGPVKNQSSPVSQIIALGQTSCSITSIQNKSLVNYKEYKIKVRSVNGDWRSPWSEEKTAVPRPQAKPAKPDNVKAAGGYRSITVSWKDMDDSDGYMVYYKEEGGQFQPVVKGFKQTAEGTGRLRENRYEITGLKDYVSYSVYVVSWNEMGWSGQSLTAVAKTKSVEPPKLPAYRLLNTSNGEGKLTAHIKDAVIGGSGSGMKGSPLDEGKRKSALGLVDDDYGSYWSKQDWDDGVAYPAASKGMTVTLDDDYEMNYFTFAAADQKGSIDRVKIEYWSLADDKNAKTVNARLLEKRDVNDNPYYIVKFDQTVTVHRIRMCLGRSWSDMTEMRVGEIHFHQYDSLEDDIMGLYTDDMHATLGPNVTAAVVQELKDRLETADEASGEKHPLYQELALELKTAEEILNSNLEPPIEVNPKITAKKDTHLGFGGLNAWQPLGKTAYAGDTLLVYVGHPTKRTGEAAQLQLVFTQHHAEAASVSRSIGLKIGRNEITVPQLSSLAFERGGQLYAAYTGNSDSGQYAVRISGGDSIPVLNLYGKTGEDKTKAVRDYITALEAHTASLKEQHEQSHSGKNQAGEYDRTNCILNATDIMMEQMMYSLPAEQVLAGLGSGELEQKAKKLEQALDAMEQMMTLFYQHKGLSSSAGTKYGNNALPSRHLNIRYMRMFAGAFMYAAGNHIGIEWGSALLASAPDSWRGFGWGIAHEIGHNINQGCYAVAEITNNYFAQLMKSINENGATRFQYENVYKKVTSNTSGRSSNVATQLAMYWQLYLAYSKSTDDGRIYDSYEEQFENLFFARTDTYARNPDKAPNGGVKLTGGTDQNLMRLACAAAGRNILAFFKRWGMEPDEETAAYAKKFSDEEKAIYYVNEECRKYRLSHPDEAGNIKGRDMLSAEVSAQSDQVTVTIRPSEKVEKGVILGYEIIRSMTSNGKEESAVVGFQPAREDGTAEYTDHIYAVNNRVMSYQVKAVDKYLNYSNTADAGSVKVETDGVLDKSQWTVQTDMVSEDDKVIQADMENPDSGYDETDPKNTQQARVNSAERIIDLKETAEGTYHGTVADDKTPASVTIDMHKTEAVTALKYKGSALASVTVEISSDAAEWKAVRTDYKGLADADQTDWETVWFDAAEESAKDHWIGTYDARYVRIQISGTSQVSVCEINLCGPSGDNVEFYETTDSQPAVGILKEDYQYTDEDKEAKIPEGSLVFAGTYKGNPAYNAVVLYDTQGNVIGEKNGKVQAEQLIFAKVPEHGELGETSDGTWVYYVEPGYWNEESIKQISGVRCELFRFDDAKTLAGERIVSDTKIIEISGSLPKISLKGESK